LDQELISIATYLVPHVVLVVLALNWQLTD